MQRKLSKIKTVSKPWVMTAARLDAMKTNWAIRCLVGWKLAVKVLALDAVHKRQLVWAINETLEALRRRNDVRHLAGKKRSARKG